MKFDVLIIGSGSSALMCALELSNNLNIVIVSKKNTLEGSSFYAQGGMSVSTDNDKARHIKDTLIAADGLANNASVEFLINNSYHALTKLTNYGVDWTKHKGSYHYVKEGGHSNNRILHIKDWTGKSIQQTLLANVEKKPNISIINDCIAIDLLVKDNKCSGAYVLNNNGLITKMLASNTIIATGGASKIYKYTTNPDTSTGDGIAMAYRAGCVIANMEFSQFHPTCLYHPQAKSFLVSESLRGYGAKLLLPNGNTFIDKYHSKKELAPRDIVARAIDAEMKSGGYKHLYLDISFKNSNAIKKHFPHIYYQCLEFKIDITTDKIPIVPAAHYSCGGINTDFNAKTNIDYLYAIGEVAHTGVHGANRLASNSILECIVFAMSCAQDINNKNKHSDDFDFANWRTSTITSKEKVIISHLWDEVRLVMWNYVGIVRSNARLNYAKKRLKQIKIEIDDYYNNYIISSDLIELRNIATCALIVVESALLRKESRGLHYNLDYKNKKNVAQNTYIARQKVKS